MKNEISQDVLTQPIREEGEDTPTWHARYTAAHAALIAAIRGLPDNHVYHSADADLPTWLGDPGVVTLFSDRSTTMTVLAFQLGDDGEPLDVVGQVNRQLDMHYHQFQGPWVHPQLATIVWWLLIHPELGVRPVELLGTDREAELVLLAANTK